MWVRRRQSGRCRPCPAGKLSPALGLLALAQPPVTMGLRLRSRSTGDAEASELLHEGVTDQPAAALRLSMPSLSLIRPRERTSVQITAGQRDNR